MFSKALSYIRQCLSYKAVYKQLLQNQGNSISVLLTFYPEVCSKIIIDISLSPMYAISILNMFVLILHVKLILQAILSLEEWQWNGCSLALFGIFTERLPTSDIILLTLKVCG